MTTEIKVPAMGESVTEATVARWFKKEGDAVKRDEPLLELETDKVTVEVPAPADGALESISVKAGDTVQVGALLGAIAEGKAGAAAAKPAAKGRSAKAGRACGRSGQARRRAPPRKPDVPAMPSAQRIAAESGLATASVAGTGKDGRVTKGDMLGALEARANKPAPAPRAAPSGPRHNAAREEIVPMTRLRKTVALRLKESQNTAAQLTTFNEVDMTAVMAARATYKDAFEKKHGVKLGFMGFFAKAVVAALKELPNVNAEIEGDNIIYKNYYDIGDRGFDRARAGGAGGARCRPAFPGRGRKGDCRFRHPRPRQQAEDRGIAGRHLLHHQWRRVRLADVHAHPQCAAVGHPGHAQDPAAPHGD